LERRPDAANDDESIRRRVCELVGEENVAPSSEVNAYTVDGKIPKVVAFPNNADAVLSVLAFANKAGLSVIPRGSGTKMAVGGIPKVLDVLVSLVNLNRIVEYEPADLFVTAEAGLRLKELQETVAKNGQRLPLDPPYTDATTLGGTVSSNSSGPMRYRFGSWRDLLLGVRVALPSGVIIKSGGKVVKNVAGYDLKKLYVGALGTLGVVTELTFRLYPLPESEKTFIASFGDMKSAADLAGRILGSDLLPYAIEALNAGAARVVADETGVQLGEASYVIVVGFGDVDQSVSKQLSTTGELAKSSMALDSIVLDGAHQEKVWNTIRNLARSMDTREPRLVACKVNVPISRGLEALDALERLAARRGYMCVASSHAGNGLVHFYLWAEPMTHAAGVDDLARVITEARDLTSQFDGTLIVERCPRQIKELVDVWGPTRSDFELMRAIKSQFDPAGILSPGRFVGGI
jgi:glycolate oxidase FAD binding subunit